MPKTAVQQQQLEAAVAAALRGGNMANTWPDNTIWIGGSWNRPNRQWEWDDGTAIAEVKWADGQPSSSANQSHEPYLCMVADGHVHDSDPPYAFGVMCEAGEAPRAAALPGDQPATVPVAAADSALPTAPPALPAAPPALPLPPTAAAPTAVGAHQRYSFVGYATADRARGACAQHGRLAMPETEAERRALQQAVDAAMASGNMSQTWPRNTIWLGGQWNSASRRWVWDDGRETTTINWAAGQPSAHAEQDREPWLCMVADGHVHDSDADYLFGVICQEEQRRGLVLRKLAQPVWVRAPPAASCLEACETRGGCLEEAWAWPRSAAELSLLGQLAQGCQLRHQGLGYDPSLSSGACSWGPGAGRCEPRAPAGTQRLCPCRGPEAPIWA